MNRRAVFYVLLSILIFSVFCSCARNEANAETTVVFNQYNSTALASPCTSAFTPESETTTATVIAIPGETTEKTSAGEAASILTAPASALNAEKKPSTISDIVNCFNSAADKIKNEKPGYEFTVTPKTDKNKIIISENVPFRNFITRFIVSAINKSSKDTARVAYGTNHNDYPVKGQVWASKLEPGALSKATCTDIGGYYEIEMLFREEKLASLPDKSEATTHGKAFTLLLNQEFLQAFGGFDITLPGISVKVSNMKFEPVYRNSYITCKIDKYSGSMITAIYYLNTYSVVDTAVLVNRKTQIIGIQMEYSVTEEYIFV